jgi:hypothetical protein
MNPFLPPADALLTHRRLGHMLQKSRHMLLRAKDPVEGHELPPAQPKPPRERGPRENRFRTRSQASDRAIVLSVITDTAQHYTDICAATGLSTATVRSCLRDLIDRKQVHNAAASGQKGRYSLPVVATTQEQRGPFDV